MTPQLLSVSIHIISTYLFTLHIVCPKTDWKYHPPEMLDNQSCLWTKLNSSILEWNEWEEERARLISCNFSGQTVVTKSCDFGGKENRQSAIPDYNRYHASIDKQGCKCVLPKDPLNIMKALQSK